MPVVFQESNVHQFSLSSRTSSCFQISQCTTPEELIACFRIIYDEYHRMGYITKSSSRIHLTPHSLFPTTRTATIKHNNSIAYTGSFVMDSELGLPAQAVFGDLFETLRNEGRVLAEGTLFAGKVSSPSHLTLSLPRLLSYGIAEMILLGVDDFLLTVHPLHVQFWASYFGFESISEIRHCSHVNSTDGILLRLDLRRALMCGCLPGRFGRIINLVETLDNHKISDAVSLDEKFVSNLFAFKPELISKLNQAQLEYFVSSYPKIKLHKEESILPLVA